MCFQCSSYCRHILRYTCRACCDRSLILSSPFPSTPLRERVGIPLPLTPLRERLSISLIYSLRLRSGSGRVFPLSAPFGSAQGAVEYFPYLLPSAPLRERSSISLICSLRLRSGSG